MSEYTNLTGVPLSIAVWLSTDNYDYDASAISCSTIIKPIRQTILSARVPVEQRSVDVLTLTKSKSGTAVHDSIERAWKDHKGAMKKLGYPQEIIDRIVVNPEGELAPDAIPVYMEKRSYRDIAGMTVSGKFDFVAEGRLEDFKNTSTFTYVKDTKDNDYCLQGSIYRWLNPDIIKEDHMAIQFIFSDWMPGKAMADPTYPKRPTEQRLIPLMSLDDTEAFIIDRITTMQTLWKAPQDQLPLCNDEELWRRGPEVKYYKNPDSRKRSTKNFNDHEDHDRNLQEAHIRHAADGGVGVVVVKPGQVIACKYCRAFPVCTQKDDLIRDGALVL